MGKKHKQVTSKSPQYYIVILCLVVAWIFSGCSVREIRTPTTPSSPSPPPPASEPADTTTLFSFSDVIEKVMPSVVYIFVEIDGDESDQPSGASGSGVIFRSDGYILTNKHVVENAQRVEVTLQDRQVYESTDIWLDDILDLAVIKIDRQDLPAAQF